MFANKIEMLRMSDSLGKEVLPHYCQIMVVERKRVDRLNLRISTPEGVPFRPTATKGGRTSLH